MGTATDGDITADIGRTAWAPIVGGSWEGPSLFDVACGADVVATANPASPVAAVAAIAKRRVEEQAVGMVAAKYCWGSCAACGYWNVVAGWCGDNGDW